MADNKIQIDFELNKSGVDKGFDEIDSAAKKALPTLGKLAVAATAAAAAITGVILKKSIDAAADYESVVNSLNVALAASGEFTKDATQEFIKFASEIQNTTKFSDDQVLSTAALIQNLGKLSREGLKGATTAAINLSSALGIDLNSAASLVGKAANGNVAAFARYGIEIKKGATDAETFANALNKLRQAFPNAAEAAAKTFSGATAQLGNAFDDVFKEIGRAFIKSPALIAVITQLKNLFSGVAEFIKNTLGSEDILKPFLSNLTTVTAFLTAMFLPSIELIGRTAVVAFNILKTGLLTILTGFVGVGAVIEKITNMLGITDSNFFAESTAASFAKLEKSANQTGASVVSVFSEQGTATTAALNGLASVQGAIDVTSGKLLEFNEGVNNIPKSFQAATVETSELLAAFTSQFKMQSVGFAEGTKGYADASEAAKTKIVSDFNQIGLAARNGLGQAAGQGFAAFGKALVTGENALKAFAKAMIGAIGSTMVSEGTGMILRGIGYSLDPFLAGFGPPLIAAGSALATFGGVLQAVGGGGGAPGGAGGSAGAGGGLSTPDSGIVAQDEDLVRGKGTAVTVNIQGNVLDRRETGLELVSIINEAFDSQGTSVVARA